MISNRSESFLFLDVKCRGEDDTPAVLRNDVSGLLFEKLHRIYTVHLNSCIAERALCHSGPDVGILFFVVG